MSARAGPRTATRRPTSKEALRKRPSPKAKGAAHTRDESSWGGAGGRRFRKASPFPERRGISRRKALWLLGGPPPTVQNEIATRGVRALVRSGIRSDGERSLPDALVQFGAKAPCTKALALRGAAGWYLPAARIGATCEATRVRSSRSWMRSRSCSRMDSTAGIGQRRSGRTPRGDEPRYCP